MTDTMHEVWAPIVGAPGYEVSTHARFRSTPRVVQRRNRWGTVNDHRVRARVLRLSVSQAGYYNATLHFGGVQLRFDVHRAMMLAFGPSIPFAGAMVRHVNDVKTDNRMGNFKWGSQRDNMQDALVNGKIPLGAARPNSKLTIEAAATIKVESLRGVSGRVLAKQYAVSETLISYVLSGRHWSVR